MGPRRIPMQMPRSENSDEMDVLILENSHITVQPAQDGATENVAFKPHFGSDRPDLTKGNASPMGGVAYLNLEDTWVCEASSLMRRLRNFKPAIPPVKSFRDME